MATNSPWVAVVQIYWAITGLFSLGILLFLLSLANHAAAFLGVGVGLQRLLKDRLGWAVGLHQLIALLLLAWLAQNPLHLPGLQPQQYSTLLYSFSVLCLLTAGVFWGNGVVALLLGYGLLFGYGLGQWYLLAPALVASSMGMGLHKQLAHLEQAQEELHRFAIHDSLTGVLNRWMLNREFMRYQSLANRQTTPLVLMSWDLDGLKRINDTKGHAEGDRTLGQCAQTKPAPRRHFV